MDEDCGDIPDVAMTLAVVGMFAEGKTAIRNVYNWRVKETERMVAMVTELTKLGVTVEEGRDYLIVHGLKPGQKPNAAVGNSNLEENTGDRLSSLLCISFVVSQRVRSPPSLFLHPQTFNSSYLSSYTLTHSLPTPSHSLS